MFSIFLDDERHPPDDGRQWIIACSFWEFRTAILENWGQLDCISFDYYLGGRYTGYDCAVFIEARLLSNPGSLPSKTFNVHSSDPFGTKRIQLLMERLYNG